MNKVAVFDCDDVLANLREPLEVLVSEHLNKHVSWTEWNQYEIGKIYNFDFNHISEMIVEREILEKLTVEPGAKELVQYYKDQGCKTVILTARGYHPSGLSLTQQWCVDNSLAIDEVICVPLHAAKRDYLKTFPRVEVYVEDNHAHAEQAYGLLNVKEVFLINRPWNQNITDVSRVSNLFEIIPHN